MTGEVFEVALHLDRIMRRVDASMHRRVPQIDTERVGPLGCMILMRLAAFQPAPIQRLVDEMGRDNSQMTRAIRGLETKGLLQRGCCADDARISLVELSPKGRAFVADIRAIMSSIVEEVIAPLRPHERSALKNLLAKL